MTGNEVRRSEFREQWRGYNPRRVDELLEQIAHALDSGRPIGSLVTNMEIPRSMRGYRMADVDDLLGQLRLQS